MRISIVRNPAYHLFEMIQVLKMKMIVLYTFWCLAKINKHHVGCPKLKNDGGCLAGGSTSALFSPYHSTRGGDSVE